MPNRAFALELKKLGEKGEFSGIAAVYGNVDAVGDMIEPGAFTKTIASSKERPLLWEHKAAIGTVTITDSTGGLLVEGRLSLGVVAAAEAFVLLKDRVVKGLSIGFEAIRSDYLGAVRRLLEIKLWEVSLTVLPANQAAIVTAVKSVEDARFRAALQEFKQGFLADLERVG